MPARLFPLYTPAHRFWDFRLKLVRDMRACEPGHMAQGTIEAELHHIVHDPTRMVRLLVSE